MHPPPTPHPHFSLWGGGGRAEGYSFYIKSKLKSELFNNEKAYTQKNVFSVLTKNLNWEILTKSLLTFKTWDGIKDEKF